jgi:hypothetical protein
LIRGTFFLPFTAILGGSALLIIREYLAKGRAPEEHVPKAELINDSV